MVAARRETARGAGLLVIDCPYCGAEHTHGAGQEVASFGAGDGHRVAHCGPGFLETSRRGYFVQEVTP